MAETAESGEAASGPSGARQRLAKRGVVLRPGTIIGAGARIMCEPPVMIGGDLSMRGSIGAYTYIRAGGRASAALKSVGRYCSISTGVLIGDGEHPTDWLSSHPFQYARQGFYAGWLGGQLPDAADREATRLKCTIGHDVWIGANSLILRGVNIGDGAIVGGGSVVTRDVPPYAIVGGAPARLIRMRFDEATVEALLALRWWRYDAASLMGIAFNDIGRAIEEVREREAAGTLQEIDRKPYLVDERAVAEAASPSPARAAPKPPPFVSDFGEGNSLEIGEGAQVRGTARVRQGQGNLLRIGKGAKVEAKIDISGEGNTVLIGEGCRFKGQILVSGNGQTVRFGDHSTAQEVYILCSEGCDVEIGRWCMFSRQIEVRTTDAHSVVDRETGHRINHARSIRVGDHVWVGLRAILNKGCVVPQDSIVGAGAFVNAGFEEPGIVLAGTPAKIVKRGVTWNRERQDSFDPDALDHWQDAGEDSA